MRLLTRGNFAAEPFIGCGQFSSALRHHGLELFAVARQSRCGIAKLATDLVEFPAPVLFSMGSGYTYGPALTHAGSTLLGGQVGTHGGLGSEQDPPEVDTFNFASRVTVPVLMVNGSHDFLFPSEASQEPLFRLLASPEGTKRHFVYEGGHVPPRLQDIARETLDWFDKYLGPVKTSAAP